MQVAFSSAASCQVFDPAGPELELPVLFVFVAAGTKVRAPKGSGVGRGVPSPRGEFFLEFLRRNGAF